MASIPAIAAQCTTMSAPRIALIHATPVAIEPIVNAFRQLWPEARTTNQRSEDRLHVRDFNPCAVLLNNDLSAGVPDILRNLDQDVIPPLDLGWHARQKSNHFGFYREVAKEVGTLIGLDPWLIDPYFTHCGKIDFQARQRLVGDTCVDGVALGDAPAQRIDVVQRGAQQMPDQMQQRVLIASVIEFAQLLANCVDAVVANALHIASLHHGKRHGNPHSAVIGEAL